MSIKSTSSKSNQEVLIKPAKSAVITSVITSVVAIAVISIFVFGDFQYRILSSNFKVSSINCWILTDAQRAYYTKIEDANKAQEANKTKLEEARTKASEAENKLKFTDQTVVLDTNFGKLNIKMLDKIAPITTENFIRLASRGSYNNLDFHRMVKQDNFKVIQGGDPKGDGTGGVSAFDTEFQDEIAAPQELPNSCKTENTTQAKPNFVDQNVYGNFDNGTITYKKGLVAMANRGANTNTSQFFVMLGDTKLPPNYTIFGEVDQADFETLDNILKEVNVVDGKNDGKPDKEIKINTATIK